MGGKHPRKRPLGTGFTREKLIIRDHLLQIEIQSAEPGVWSFTEGDFRKGGNFSSVHTIRTITIIIITTFFLSRNQRSLYKYDKQKTTGREPESNLKRPTKKMTYNKAKLSTHRHKHTDTQTAITLMCLQRHKPLLSPNMLLYCLLG